MFMFSSTLGEFVEQVRSNTKGKWFIILQVCKRIWKLINVVKLIPYPLASVSLVVNNLFGTLKIISMKSQAISYCKVSVNLSNQYGLMIKN